MLRFGPRLGRGALIVFSFALLGAGPVLAQNNEGAHYASLDVGGKPMSDMRNMTEADMARSVHDFYKTHPVAGRISPNAAAVDTFLATGFTFDTDGNLGTQVDTMKISTNQTVLWHALNGTHTVTSGTGSADPNSGLLFDASISNPGTTDFSYTFTSAGKYDFYCFLHENFNMRGVVLVTDPADTFTVDATSFDTDHNPATQVDTAYIRPGQSIYWIVTPNQGEGVHTVTNGTGSLDPSAGTLFDVNVSPVDSTFIYTFNQQGTFPFFCRVHEAFNMKGVVVVTDAVGVPPLPNGKQIGFASEPEPNPTRGSVSFRLAMPAAGHASVRVFDTRGQLVAIPFDGDLGAGVRNVSWNGLRRDGGRAASGVYYLRVTLPGYRDSRSVVLTH